MAEIAVPSMAEPTRKKRSKGDGRKALKDKASSTSEANMLAQTIAESPAKQVPPPSPLDAQKENHESLSLPRSSPKKGKGKASSKSKPAKDDFEKELFEMQEKLRLMCLEKEKNEELLKSRDEMLKQKEEELELKGKEQEKLQMELKKLQKLKEFKPTVSFPVVQSLRDKEQDKKEKKKGCVERKRPLTPYIQWCKEQWNEIKKENSDADFKDVSNMLGAKWKQVTAEEKKPYEEKYQAEKEAYLQETAKDKRETEAMKLLEEDQKQKTAMELLEQYLQFKDEADKEVKTKKDKKEIDPLKPKQPLSAFFVFSNERRAAVLAQGKTILEASKAAGEEWKSMTEEQKGPYEEVARKNKERYLKEMEAYKQKKDGEANDLKREEEELMKLQKQEAMQLLKKKEKTENILKKTKDDKKKKKQNEEKKVVDPNKPKRPASSYLLFCKEARKTLNEERPGMNNSTLTAMISVKWKELSEEERQVWNAKAAEAMEAYKKDMEEYNKSVATTSEST